MKLPPRPEAVDPGAGLPAPLVPLFVDENGLTAFRDRYLAAGFLLAAVAAAPGRVAVGSVPVGVGKSNAIDGIFLSPATWQQYDLVIAVSPTWRIIHERPIVRGAVEPLVGHLVLRPRPRARCGALDAAWQRYERAGNAAYARWELCSICPHFFAADPCPWPARFEAERWEAIRLVFCTEEHLRINRNFVAFLKALTGAKRVLLLLDEAQVASAPFEITITPRELALFSAAIAAATDLDPDLDPRLRAIWLASVDTLARAGAEGLADAGWRFPDAINAHALAIQRAGLALARDFRYLGHDLALFPGSRREERGRGDDGRLRFTARPRLDADVLILSAHMRPAFVAHRLGLDQVAAPFEGLRVAHSATRAYNLKSAIGMKKYFRRNAPQVLGFVAALVARNLLQERTTVLVSRKDEKAFCARELADLLATLPLPAAVRFVTEAYEEMGPPDPAVVPIIHYGMVGVNDFEHYETCYALNSYYVPNHVLDQSLQGHEPDPYAVAVHVELDAARNRRVVVTDPAHAGSGLDRLGDVHLRKLEVDVALQAVGRVRFSTRPREVLFFQLHDLAPEVEAVELGSLAAARAAFGVPRFKDLQVAAGAARLRALRARGATLAEAAAVVGVHAETARRWLARKTPDDVFQRAFVAAAEVAS